MNRWSPAAMLLVLAAVPGGLSSSAFAQRGGAARGGSVGHSGPAFSGGFSSGPGVRYSGGFAPGGGPYAGARVGTPSVSAFRAPYRGRPGYGVGGAAYVYPYHWLGAGLWPGFAWDYDWYDASYLNTPGYGYGDNSPAAYPPAPASYYDPGYAQQIAPGYQQQAAPGYYGQWPAAGYPQVAPGYGQQQMAPGYAQQEVPSYSQQMAPGYGRQMPPAALPQGSTQASSGDPVTLIFNDGRQPQQIQNYIATATSISVVEGRRTRVIPVSELNLAATFEANRRAGVDFEIPATQ